MTQPTAVPPKHQYYVSLSNDGIYPALSSPSGYEDEHPSEYRAATASEVEEYKAGVEAVVIKPLPVDYDQLGVTASPATIQLAPEPPVDIVPPAPPLAAPVSPPDPAPILATPVSPIGPAPVLPPAPQSE